MNVETIKFLIKIDYLEKKLIGEDKKIFVELFYLFNECVRMLEEKELQAKKQKEVIDRAIEYIENEMLYLQEIDKEYEDINGNTYFTYKEYDGKELLDILKEVLE